LPGRCFEWSDEEVLAADRSADESAYAGWLSIESAKTLLNPESKTGGEVEGGNGAGVVEI
jgi:hypothetical protein